MKIGFTKNLQEIYILSLEADSWIKENGYFILTTL